MKFCRFRVVKIITTRNTLAIIRHIYNLECFYTSVFTTHLIGCVDAENHRRNLIWNFTVVSGPIIVIMTLPTTSLWPTPGRHPQPASWSQTAGGTHSLIMWDIRGKHSDVILWSIRYTVYSQRSRVLNNNINDIREQSFSYLILLEIMLKELRTGSFVEECYTLSFCWGSKL